jgi:hypothetical protein
VGAVTPRARPRRHRTPHRFTGSEQLAALAHVLDQAFVLDGWGQPPSIVRVTGAAPGARTGTLELGLRPVTDLGGGVIDALLGFTAPPAWHVIGAVSEGTAHPLDGGVPQTARVIHLVSRQGESASVVRLLGDDDVQVDASAGPPDGRLDEVCRRVLALPTAPPESSPQALWASTWLDRVLARSAGSGTRAAALSWADVAALHPAVTVIAPDDPALAAEAGDHLEEMGNALVLAFGWGALRARCAAGEWPVPGIPPSLAAWMDDGMFARWAMFAYPALDVLFDDLDVLLAPDVHARIATTLTRWRLLTAAA